MNAIRLVLMTALAVSPSLHAAETVTRVTDINPGFRGSYPCYLTIYNQQLCFRANTGLQDTELWRFDGTNAARVADIVPGTNGSSPSLLAVFNGSLYFDATTTAGPVKLHRYDSSTVSPLNTSPSAFWGGGGWSPVTWNGELWFWTLASPAALACFNGTRVARLNSPPWVNSDPVVFENQLYYAAQDAFGVELWRFNGLNQTRLSDINPGAADGRPEALFAHDGALYFRANDGLTGNELWRHTSGTPQRVTDIFPGPGSANPGGFATFRGALYFAADDGVHGLELWRYDGTTTTLAADINPNPYENEYGDETSHSNPSQLTVLNDTLYFIANDGTNYGVWSYDGTNTVILGGGLANWTTELIVFQDTLYFDADDGVWGRELWKVEPNPEPRLELTRPVDTTQVTLTEAETGLYSIEVSSDFLNWTPVSTNRPVDGQIILQDAATNTPQRFYRAVKAL